MRLKKLYLHRGYSSDDHLRGDIEFQTNDGNQEIKLVLDESLSRKIVGLCSDAIVEAGKKAAQNLTADVMAIEHKADE